jgi:hypothetical protein
MGEDERERALCGRPPTAAEGSANVLELELREGVRPTEVALGERVEREPIGEKAGPVTLAAQARQVRRRSGLNERELPRSAGSAVSPKQR